MGYRHDTASISIRQRFNCRHFGEYQNNCIRVCMHINDKNIQRTITVGMGLRWQTMGLTNPNSLLQFYISLTIQNARVYVLTIIQRDDHSTHTYPLDIPHCCRHMRAHRQQRAAATSGSNHACTRELPQRT